MNAPGLLVSVSVIGAVAVGGAVTGTTLAQWTDRSTVEEVSVTSGSISLGVAAGGGAAQAALVLPPMRDLDGPRSVEFTVVNTGTGRNLRVAMTADVSATRPDGTPAPLGFHVAPVAAGASCSPAASAVLTPSVTAVELAGASAPGETTRACLTVGRTTTALPAAAETYAVTATVRGTQVRGLP